MPSRSISSRRICSPISFRLASSVSATRARDITVLTGENDATVGSSMSSGNVTMPSMVLLTSFNTRFRSAPPSSCRVAAQPPSRAVEVMRWMFSTFSRASSRCGLLDFFRGRARIGHVDLNGAGFDAGKLFLPRIHVREDARHQEHHHQQVGGNGVVNEPVNDRSHCCTT